MREIVLERLSGRLERTIIMPIAGIYSIELDNSYSWVNHKQLTLSMNVLTPLQLTPIDHHALTELYYPELKVSSLSSSEVVYRYNEMKLKGYI